MTWLAQADITKYKQTAFLSHGSGDWKSKACRNKPTPRRTIVRDNRLPVGVIWQLGFCPQARVETSWKTLSVQKAKFARSSSRLCVQTALSARFFTFIHKAECY